MASNAEPSDVTDELLVTVADKLYPQHLQSFATTLIGLSVDEYQGILKDAEDDPAKQGIQVLRAWNNRTPRTRTDLCSLLKDAERLGFVHAGTLHDVAPATVCNPEYVGSSPGEPRTDLANMLAAWYTGPVWLKMPHFPWMDQKTLLLSEVYTEMEMEEYKGRWKKITAVPLNDYKELFKDVESNGTRILVKGDPGIGKSTFVQRLAFDWATKHLVMFDMVLVVKLKFTDKTQSIAGMVKDQTETLWEDDQVSEVDIANYMKSESNKVLLVLDGLDEINLKQYPQVREILLGGRYRKCCILATTRPHVAETLHNKMTSIAKIKGFSEEQAKRFVGHILDRDELITFFQEMNRKKMSQMYRVPLIIQLLALIYQRHHKLLRTYTITYDELVLFLRKSWEQSKELTEDELQAAMDEVSFELAFKGLIREDKKLVFSRDEIKNDNVRKLGILTAEKAGSGLKPTEVLCYVHKTVQEHSASDHVVKRLLNDDRGPWEALLEQFHKDAATMEVSYTTDKDHTQTDSKKEENSIFPYRNSILKIWENKELLIDVFQKLVEIGTFDGEIDSKRISEVFTSHPLLKKVLTEEEIAVLVHHLVEFLWTIPNASRPFLKYTLHIVLREQLEDPNQMKVDLGTPPSLQDCVEFVEVVASIGDEQNAINKMKRALDAFENYSPVNATFFLCHLPTNDTWMEIAEQWLLEYSQYETLFRFIIGKLADHPAVRDVILQEIASLVVQYSFYSITGGVLPVEDMLSFMRDLKSESLPDYDYMESDPELDPFLVTPPLIYLTSMKEFSDIRNMGPETPCALKVSGTTANIPEFIPKVASHIKHLRNIHILELQSIEDLDRDLSLTYQEFTTVLYQSPHLSSIQLRNIDPNLTGLLMQNLPLSVQMLGIRTVPTRRTRRGTLTFPPEVHLVSIHLCNCLSIVGGLFKNTTFPNLEIMSYRNTKHDKDDKEKKQFLMWTKEDVQSLQDAVRTGRMPALGDLTIGGCCLTGCGPELVEILKAESIRWVKFNGVELSTDDVEVIVKNVQDGNLNHILRLELMYNSGLSPTVVEHLGRACLQHNIDLAIADQEDLNKRVLGLDQAVARKNTERTLALAILASSFTSEQVENITTLIVSLTQEQRQKITTLLNLGIPRLQKRPFCIFLSIFTPEQAALWSHYVNQMYNTDTNTDTDTDTNTNTDTNTDTNTNTKTDTNTNTNTDTDTNTDTNTDTKSTNTDIELQGSAKRRSKAKRFIDHLYEVLLGRDITSVIDSLSFSTPEQEKTMSTILCSLTPQQFQTMINLIPRITSEMTQTLVTLMLSVNQEQVNTTMNLFSRMIQEAEVSDIGNLVGTDSSTSQELMGNNVAQNMATLVSDFFQKQPSSTAHPETPSREVPDLQLDFSSIRNLARTLFDSSNSANQDKPQERKEDPQCRSDAPQPEFDFSCIRNLARTLFDTDNSTNQDQPQERKEDSQQKRKDYRDDLDLD